MPFPASDAYVLSNKDIVSFAFDDPTYDVDKPVFIDPGDPSRYLSHRNAKELVQQLIAGLHAAGLKRNDTVCIHSFNSIHYAVFVLATIGAGGVSVGTNPSYSRGELDHAVKVARVKYVLTEPEILSNMTQALKDNGIDIDRRLFILDTRNGQEVPEGLPSWRELLKHGKRDWARFDDEEKSTNSVAALFYTSGTTGLPKCAMTTHRNMVAEHQLYFEANPRPYPFKEVLCLPFFHIGMQPQVIVSALKEGRDAYVMRKFELEPYLKYHTKYQLTEIFSVPPIISAVVMSGLADPSSKSYRPEYSLGSVRNGTTGAAPCSGDLQRRFSELLADNATFTQVWGMTETTCVAIAVPSDVSQRSSHGQLQLWGAVGKPLAGIQVKLVDETGRDVTDQGNGEICVKGPTVVKGYFEDQRATKESWDADGFFKTGDVAELDQETGVLYVVERLKELIKVRGFQCAPAELEGALTEHADVVDAAVIGIRVSAEEEAPRAYIVKRPGSTLSEEHVHQHMQQRLTRYKQLTGGVIFVDSIPKLPSGKILKRVLREQAKQQTQASRGPRL